LLPLLLEVLKITNAYDWIIVTAASRIKRRICAVINTVNSVCLIDGPLFPYKISSRCRAIVFAVKRSASVPGRIRLLIQIKHPTRCNNQS